MKKTALVLTGGGARAAYQVGCLKAISEIINRQEHPFEIITGFSAGAINGTWIASRNDRFDAVTESLWEAWAKITTDQIFKSDAASLSKIAFQWIKARTSGGGESANQVNFLLDTEPLHEFLLKHIDFDALKRNIDSKRLHGFCILAANYHSGKSTAFYTGDVPIQNWEGSSKASVHTDLEAKHVMASSAIPIFFKPIQIGDSFFGDGMVRLRSPLSPAIHMGADQLLVIGVKGDPENEQVHTRIPNQVTLGEIAGNILNGLFFDALDEDLFRIERVNLALSAMKTNELQIPSRQLRHIPLLTLKPSKTLSASSKCQITNLPSTLRFFLRGIGVSATHGSDLLSYLAFEPNYTQSLLALGYEETMARRSEIQEFFQ